MANTQVSKSLNISLRIWYNFLANGEIPKVPTIGTMSEERWIEFLNEIKGKELSGFRVPAERALQKEFPGLVKIWERAQVSKKVEFQVGNVSFCITMQKDTETNEWAFHSLDWTSSYPGYRGRSIRAPF